MTACVVAVLTYRRNDVLGALLPRLVDQAGSVSPAARVLVVDNDPDAGARSTVSDHAATLSRAQVRLDYVHEPEPGIAAARNRALDEARGADQLVFIDDDEIPQPDWLVHLTRTAAGTGAAAVVGPVESIFDVKPDDWVAAGGFFRRRRPPTGTVVDVAATNNLLLDLAVVERLRLRFDAAFGLSGGSDTLFTRQLSLGGGRMVWCDEALVLDRVPAERVTREWVLARAFRSGNSWARTSLVLAVGPVGRARVRASLVGRGGARVLAGVLQMLIGTVRRDLGAQAKGARRLRRGAGLIAGSAGHVHVEYRRPAAPGPS